MQMQCVLTENRLVRMAYMSFEAGKTQALGESGGRLGSPISSRNQATKCAGCHTITCFCRGSGKYKGKGRGKGKGKPLRNIRMDICNTCLMRNPPCAGTRVTPAGGISEAAFGLE